MRKQRFWPYVAIVATCIMWGLSFLSIKVTVEVLPPMTLALIRFLMASVLLIIVLRWREPKTRLSKKDYPLMILAGVIGVTAYFYFENTGVKLTTASTASIIIATIPIVTLLADSLFCGNRLSKKKLGSVLLSLIGVYLVVGTNLNELMTSGQGKGYFMMLGASISWVVYTLVTRPLGERYSQLAVVCYQTVFGTIALFPFALLEKTEWNLVSGTILWNVAFLGVFCSALGYYLYIYTIYNLGVNVTTLCINLIPVVTVIASYFLLKELINIQQVAGGALVLTAVYLTSWPVQSKKPCC